MSGCLMSRVALAYIAPLYDHTAKPPSKHQEGSRARKGQRDWSSCPHHDNDVRPKNGSQHTVETM
jgi:hypothetical protein